MHVFIPAFHLQKQDRGCYCCLVIDKKCTMSSGIGWEAIGPFWFWWPAWFCDGLGMMCLTLPGDVWGGEKLTELKYFYLFFFFMFPWTESGASAILETVCIHHPTSVHGDVFAWLGSFPSPSQVLQPKVGLFCLEELFCKHWMHHRSMKSDGPTEVSYMLICLFKSWFLVLVPAHGCILLLAVGRSGCCRGLQWRLALPSFPASSSGHNLFSAKGYVITHAPSFHQSLACEWPAQTWGIQNSVTFRIVQQDRENKSSQLLPN